MELSSLTLTVTERCNLRCSYCTVPSAGGRAMKDDVIDASIELFARHAAKEATLSFYGGEPFLAVDKCRRALDGMRERSDGKRRLRVLTATNVTALDPATLAWCRDEDIELALSIDGDERETERRFADGRPATPELLRRLPDVLGALPARRTLARMTVTPQNVGRLSKNVRRLARLGFARIVYQVAYELVWDETSVARFGREHRRIGTWLIGAAGAGKRVPDLPGWRAIEERLLLGRGRGACGAGRRIAAVSTDGGLYPCYRLVFRGDDDQSRLGDVVSGFTNAEALERFGAFDPNDVDPEDSDCASCSARDGCTHACPALGLEMLGDIRRVPSVACRLMREQVAAIRPYASLARGPRARSTAQRLAAAVVAAAVAGAAASCGGSTEGGPAIDSGIGGNAGDGSVSDVIGPGVCVAVDSGGGVCPVQIDASTGGFGGGGICDTGGAAGYGGGGLCPVQVDAGDDTGPGGYGGGGICPVQVDAGDDGSSGVGGGGICPYIPDSGTGGFGGGGLC